MRAAPRKEVGDDLLASRREETGEIGDEIEHAGAAAHRAGGEADGYEQGREEGEEEIKGNRLSDHAAPREDSREGAQDASGNAGRRRHRGDYTRRAAFPKTVEGPFG